MAKLYPGSLILALLLATHGLRSHSLAPSGAVTAAVLGYLTLGNPSWVFGSCLIVFYLAGSRATKVKASYKATLEDDGSSRPVSTDARKPGSEKKPGGNRTASQVVCNALVGTCCALAWRYGVPSLAAADGSAAGGRAWVLAAVAFWGSCCGDTFASEFGILSSTPPILITTFRPVVPGTNGGISSLGFLVSLLGGLLIGFTGWLAVLAGDGSEGCGFELVWVGAVSGQIGSLIDSLLGATLQYTFYDPDSKKVLLHPPKSVVQSGRLVQTGSLGILNNDGVNFVTGVIVALGTLIGANLGLW